MSLLSRVLEGLGQGLIKQGEFNQQQQMQQMLFDREVALKGVDAQIAQAANDRNFQERLTEISATGNQNRATDLFQGEINSRLDSQKSTQTLNNEITLKGIDFSNSSKLEALKSKLQMTDQQFQSVLEAQKTATANGTTVDRVVFSKNGQMQVVYKNGNIVSKGPTGAYNASGTDSSSLSDLINCGGSPNAGANSGGVGSSTGGAGGGIAPTMGANSAAPQPASQTGTRAAALAQAGTAYANASQNPAAYKNIYPGMYDASGNLLPQEQVVAKINQAYPDQQ